jgi:hypothetical protein
VSICFLPYVHDQVRDIWMVPGAARDDPGNFELSISNANGADLLCTLGWRQNRAADLSRSNTSLAW